MTAITVPGMFLTGDHASRPAASAVGGGSLYSCTDHDLIYQSDTSSWTTWATVGGGGGVATDPIWNAAGDLAVGTGSDTAARLGIGSTGDVLTVSGGTAAWAAPSGASPPDPVFELFGTPATAFEFDTSSLSGLTAMGSPDVEDADTTIPGHLYIQDLNGSYQWCSRYLTSPSAPWTAITKVETHPTNNYNAAGLWLGVASPGNMDLIGVQENGGVKVNTERVTPTASGSGITATGWMVGVTYLAICVNSSSDVDFLWSRDGHIWRYLTEARNPSLTIATVGIGVKAENGSRPGSAAFDYLRIFNSALTFPGAG